jgi:hypothetical protein
MMRNDNTFCCKMSFGFNAILFRFDSEWKYFAMHELLITNYFSAYLQLIDQIFLISNFMECRVEFFLVSMLSNFFPLSPIVSRDKFKCFPNVVVMVPCCPAVPNLD